MNIKKIITEEVNDFEWTQSIHRPIEVGDTVRCLPGFTTENYGLHPNSGGAGYCEGHTFEVIDIHHYPNDEHGDVLWGEPIDGNSRGGVFSQAVELVE